MPAIKRVERLVEKYEAPRADRWDGRLPPDYLADQIGAIVGFELPIDLLRHLLETLDLLYDAFGRVRLGENWPKELVKVQKWLQRDERGRLSAIG